MKIKEGFILKDVAGNKIVIATGQQRMEFNGVITFNDVGADVFTMLDGSKSVDDIISHIASDYGVDESTVKTDVEKLIEKMKKYNLIED